VIELVVRGKDGCSFGEGIGGVQQAQGEGDEERDAGQDAGPRLFTCHFAFLVSPLKFVVQDALKNR